MSTTQQEWNPTWDELRAGIHALCKERGWHHGVPIMSSTDTSREIVLAKGCPLSEKHGHDRPVAFGEPTVHICRSEDIDEGALVAVNDWKPISKRVVVLREKGKAKVGTLDESYARFNMLVTSLLCAAGAVSTEAELRAMVSLFARLNANQLQMYVLTGCFTETSSRSGVSYIFRKGLPTVAIKCEKVEGGERRRFLAALCSHPLAWYAGTHVGAYPPSDEILANLLAVRADEHAFWKKSNQHSINDPMAGI